MPDPVPTPQGAGLWLAGARVRTLPAAVVPVLVGTAAVAGPAELGLGRGIIGWRFAAALVVAVAIQIGTNFANDYSDGVRGTDDGDRVGPLRLVGSGLVDPARVKGAAMAAFGVAAVAGLTLAAAVGWELILVGAVSLAAGWLYTGGPKPYGYHGLGELFVFIFFGLVATVGSAYVQTGQLSDAAFAAAVPVGLLAMALLVVNNLRDIASDTRAGKRTMAVKMGDRSTRLLYVGLLAGPAICVPVVAGVAGRPAVALALAGLVPARRRVVDVLSGATGPDLVAVLAGTGRVQLAYGGLMAVGLWLGA